MGGKLQGRVSLVLPEWEKDKVQREVSGERITTGRTSHGRYEVGVSETGTTKEVVLVKEVNRHFK